MAGDQNADHRAERLLELLAQLVFKGMAGKAGDEGEITRTQFLGLRYLRLHENCTMGSLASGLGISQPAATKLVERLEERALALRERGAGDRRKTLIRLMPRGFHLSERVLREHSRQSSEMVSQLEAGLRESVVVGLEDLLERALPDARAAQQICLRCGPHHDPDCVVNRAHLAACGKPVVP